MSGQKANRSIAFVALNSSAAATLLAHGVGAEIAFNSAGGAADWIMLSPLGADGLIKTVDKRGPYKIADAAKLIQASLNAHHGRIPVDENHATDLAAPTGGPSPARGWIVEMQPRSDGIYGRVEWSSAGAALMSEKAYRYISPVFIVDKAGTVLDMPRVSLTNTPNLLGMAALHSQETNDMDLLTQLRNILGLGADADEAAVLAKLKDALTSSAAMNSIAKVAGIVGVADNATVINAVTALKAGLAPIAKAAGLKDDADGAAIVTAINAISAAAKGNGSDTIVALQSEVKELGEKLSTALTTSARDKATAFVDGAIREARVGVKPMRERYITMHMADAAGTEQLIGAMPKIGGAVPPAPPQLKDGKIELNAEQKQIADLMGLSHEDYAKTLTAEAATAT